MFSLLVMLLLTEKYKKNYVCLADTDRKNHFHVMENETRSQLGPGPRWPFSQPNSELVMPQSYKSVAPNPSCQSQHTSRPPLSPPCRDPSGEGVGGRLVYQAPHLA